MTPTIGFAFVPPDLNNVLLFLVAGSLAAMLFSIAKAGFGGSVGILAIPLMIFACGDRTTLALGIMLPMLIAADYIAVALWWRKWDPVAVLRLMPGAALGILAAWAGLGALRAWGVEGHEKLGEHALKLMIGLIALGFVGLRVLRWLRRTDFTFTPTWPRMLLIGAAAGVTSTFAHAAGPVVAMYLLSLRMPKSRYVASTAALFWLINHAKLPVYLHLGMIRPDTLVAAVPLLPAIVAGALAGLFLHRLVGERQFAGIVYGLLALAAGGLIYKAAEALWA